MAQTTTILTATEAFKTLLGGVTGADPGGTAKRIRSVFWGQGGPNQAPQPFLALQVMQAVREEGADGNNEWGVQIKVRVVFPVSAAAKAHDDAQRYLAQITNLVDGWLPADGIEGGEASDWSIVLPTEPTQGSVGYIEGLCNMRVRTARGSN
jgi:hypothetical protein